MSWEDDLKRKLKTPEQAPAEAEQKKRAEHADGVRAASQALSEIRRTLTDAQLMLASKNPEGVLSSGDDSSLTFAGHTVVPPP